MRKTYNMRKIKFRAFQDDKMIYQGDNGVYGTKKFFDTLYEDTILMQHIEVYDTDGKDIYDGDILVNTRDERLLSWIVCYLNGSIGIRNLMDGRIGDFFRVDSNFYFADRKIIGNVYENRNLIDKIHFNSTGFLLC